MSQKILIPLLLLFLLSSPTSHASLIINGGFETGDLTGWTCRDAFFCAAVPSGSDGAPPAHSGDYLFGGNTFRAIGSLTQTFATVIGQEYELSFFSIFDSADDMMYFKYAIDGIDGRPDHTDYWLNTRANFFASAKTTTISFLFSTSLPGEGPVGLDDISVESTGTIPVPAILSLFCLALAGLGWTRRNTKV